MIEVSPRLYVGSMLDYERRVKEQPGWYVVQAAKEPYHREALNYKSQGAPRDHLEYLYAQRDNRLILNMVDVDNHKYFDADMIEAALTFIHDMLSGNPVCKVLVHCNQGHSRAPSLALLYLRRHDPEFADLSFADGVRRFKSFYRHYEPAAGIRDYLKLNWDNADVGGRLSGRDDTSIRA